MLSVFHLCVATKDTEKKGGTIKMLHGRVHSRPFRTGVLIAAFSVFAPFVFFAHPADAQKQQIVWSEQEKPIVQQLRSLRQVPDEKRGQVTKELALETRRLPAGPNKLTLANGLANLSTEGDFGHDTLQEVATTLATALDEHPPRRTANSPPNRMSNWPRWCATSTCRRLRTLPNSRRRCPSLPTTTGAASMRISH